MLKRINEYTSTVLLFCLILFMAGSPVYAATYNTKTGELSLPAVYDGEKTYTDVILKLNSDGRYSFLQRTEAALPFQCTNNFNESTLDLITDQMSVSDINSLLGCDWSSSYASVINFGETEAKTINYSWFDTQCTSINLSYHPDGFVDFKFIRYTNECKLIPNDARVYDMTNNRFIIQNVIVDDIFVAPFTVLKFDVEKETWALISAEIVDRGQPPYLCNLFTEDLFASKLKLSSTISEMENVLGCQWSERSDNSFTYRDHECGVVHLSQDPSSKEINYKALQYKKAGCGT